MTTRPLQTIATEIVRGVHDFYHDTYPQNIDDVFSDLVFKKANEHLNTGMELHEPSGIYLTPRKPPLHGTEVIDGDMLLFDFTGHTPLMVLFAYDSLKQLEDDILSEGGILNPFTTLQIPIIEGKARRFAIQYTHAQTGRIVKVDLKEIGMEKNRSSEKMPAFPEEENMTNLRLIWLD